MPDSFKFELVSPERLLVSEDAESVVIPGTEGEMTVLVQHAPVMTALKPGVVTVKPADGAAQRFVVFGGFADVLPDSCTVLAESAVAETDLNREHIASRVEKAREDVKAAPDDLSRTKAEEFLHDLTTLEGVIIPA